MALYKSDFRFQLWDYTASLKKVLFRNPASDVILVNTDIVFVGVDSLNVQTDFDGGAIPFRGRE